MSVVLLTGSFPPRVCGVGDYTSHLADALRETGAPVEVWTRDRETEPAGSVRPVAPNWSASGVRALVRELEKARPFLVHLQYERSVFDQSLAVCFLLPRLLKQAKIPLVTTFHALDGPVQWGKLHRAALLPLLYESENVVVCSQRQLGAVRRLPGLAARARLIPVGSVIPAAFDRPEGMDNSRPLRLIYFGFVWRGRNIELLLETLARVRQTQPNATLEIVGAVRDPVYAAQLVREMSDDLADRVFFRGELPALQISRALANADIALLPFASGVSTGRTTLMAALEHSLPIVTWGTPGNHDPLFADGDNLEIAPLGDTREFIRRTIALTGDAAKCAHLSRGAHLLARAFAWPEIAHQTRALPAYRKALGK